MFAVGEASIRKSTPWIGPEAHVFGGTSGNEKPPAGGIRRGPRGGCLIMV